MSRTKAVNDMLARHVKACEFRGPVDREAIATALREHIKACGGPDVTVKFADTWASAARAASAAWDAWAAWDASAASAARAANAAWDACWVSCIVCGAEELQNGELPKWLPTLIAVEAGAWLYWIGEREITVVTIPTIYRDERNRPHRPDGPAFVSMDLTCHFWHGVLVPEYVIERPQEITCARIDGEDNTEVRRVMLDRYGWERYLTDSGTQAVQRDDVGELYRKAIPGDEDLVMVRVLNSTPEPDGSIKPYTLRVPPNIKTARAAVAWTFGMKPNEYKPSIET